MFLGVRERGNVERTIFAGLREGVGVVLECSFMISLHEGKGAVVKKPQEKVFLLRLTVVGCTPRIWRRLVVRESMWLSRLHDSIQVAFDWYDYQTHEFVLDDVRLGNPVRKDDVAVEDDRDVSGQVLEAHWGAATLQPSWGVITGLTWRFCGECSVEAWFSGDPGRQSAPETLVIKLRAAQADGRVIRNSTSGGPFAVHSAEPLWASAIARTMARPRPVPPRSARVVTKRRKSRFSTWRPTWP